MNVTQRGLLLIPLALFRAFRTRLLVSGLLPASCPQHVAALLSGPTLSSSGFFLQDGSATSAPSRTLMELQRVIFIGPVTIEAIPESSQATRTAGSPA